MREPAALASKLGEVVEWNHGLRSTAICTQPGWRHITGERRRRLKRALQERVLTFCRWRRQVELQLPEQPLVVKNGRRAWLAWDRDIPPEQEINVYKVGVRPAPKAPPRCGVRQRSKGLNKITREETQRFLKAPKWE